MSALKKIAKGFTLIELMIVVAIIGILAAIAIPNFLKFQCKAKQTEAKTGLKAVYTTQLAYNGEFGSYLNLDQLTSFGGLDTKTVGNTKYYNYTITGGSNFSATAQDNRVRINTSGADDIWTIDQNSAQPANGTNACN
ncbi:MAG: prepilin-type N-terminal cleavage/methylation domain-containing protein [Deltaproteobacteria bacterium]|nr:prepilin-type N-terminal cleavage/methylation domain-containing protein [Deltaproteobacteria bacterium]